MLIEQYFPRVIGGKATLQSRLAAEGRESGLSTQEIEELISMIPLKLLNAGCFLDRLTNLWRYEYGQPYELEDNRLLLGAHMWIPVKYLFAVICCAKARVPEHGRRRYFARLVNPEKHEDTLAEFLPILRLSEGIAVDFEVPTGIGGRNVFAHNVDWGIYDRTGRAVLIEVKSRMRDLLQMAARIDKGERDPNGTAPAPTHDVSLLFRSIEGKYAPNDVERQLQGAWITTNVQQEEVELATAFDTLDPSKIHFVILGGWEPGIKLLTRRDEDFQFLIELFREEISDRFHFARIRCD